MKENKYQEALNTLVKYAHQSPNVGWALIYEENILQEIIDKETPMKPLWETKGYRRCSTCKLRLVSTNNQFINYCSDCGQKVDWGDEE